MPPPLPAAYPRYISYDYSNPNVYANEKVPHKQAISPLTPQTPLPAAYIRQLSYGLSKAQIHNQNVYMEEYESNGSAKSPDTDVESLEMNCKVEGDGVSTGKRKKSVLLFLRDSQFYIRVIAILIMIVSLSLILIVIISFAKAQRKAGNIYLYPFHNSVRN